MRAKKHYSATNSKNKHRGMKLGFENQFHKLAAKAKPFMENFINNLCVGWRAITRLCHFLLVF
jgi:hypothetical protein